MNLSLRYLFLVYLIVFGFATSSFGAKRNFKGLFGSYKQEKFIENEAESGFGLNLALSTLIPISPYVKSSNSLAETPTALHFATYFNFEAEITYALKYKWVPFLRVGYMVYETRKQSTEASTFTPKAPVFHNVKLISIPLMGGIRYRFGRDDIVPFIGIAGGIYFIDRATTYDGSNLDDQQTFTRPAGELGGGFEFFFSRTAGLKLEIAVQYLNISEDIVNKNPGNPANNPIVTYQANPISLRYAGGIFMLF